MVKWYNVDKPRKLNPSLLWSKDVNHSFDASFCAARMCVRELWTFLTGLSYFVAVCHAELNAIMNKNSADVKGCTMYVALFPCNECAKLIIQAGESVSEMCFWLCEFHDVHVGFSINTFASTVQESNCRWTDNWHSFCKHALIKWIGDAPKFQQFADLGEMVLEGQNRWLKQWHLISVRAYFVHKRWINYNR